jgi:hypothetical protein
MRRDPLAGVSNKTWKLPDIIGNARAFRPLITILHPLRYDSDIVRVKRRFARIGHMPEQMTMAAREAVFAILAKRLPPYYSVATWKQFREHHADLIGPTFGDKEPKASVWPKPLHTKLSKTRHSRDVLGGWKSIRPTASSIVNADVVRRVKEYRLEATLG